MGLLVVTCYLLSYVFSVSIRDLIVWLGRSVIKHIASNHWGICMCIPNKCHDIEKNIANLHSQESEGKLVTS